MPKVFEDYFSDLQADMVSICLEYVNNKADDIYIYCSYEPEMYAFDVFYRINNKVVLKHKVNEAITGENNKENTIFNVSEERQEALLDIGIKSLQEIHKYCKEFGREMPTEMKLHYDVKQNSLKGQYKYDLVYSEDDELLPDDIFDLWYEEIKSNI
ncbi:DUF600 domain-containing protein [Scopulibacillus cellulosilyticus]|uniref:DUF600 domain-containing protein n=1 Tax=Scopulibacillus cellulosilyticus TaxID=2665665 RepID=A0ABW2PVQ9_9BACL